MFLENLDQHKLNEKFNKEADRNEGSNRNIGTERLRTSKKAESLHSKTRAADESMNFKSRLG